MILQREAVSSDALCEPDNYMNHVTQMLKAIDPDVNSNRPILLSTSGSNQ